MDRTEKWVRVRRRMDRQWQQGQQQQSMATILLMKPLSPAPKNRRTPTRVIFGVGNSVMHQIVVEAEATTILSSSIAGMVITARKNGQIA